MIRILKTVENFEAKVNTRDTIVFQNQEALETALNRDNADKLIRDGCVQINYTVPGENRCIGYERYELVSDDTPKN